MFALHLYIHNTCVCIYIYAYEYVCMCIIVYIYVYIYIIYIYIYILDNYTYQESDSIIHSLRVFERPQNSACRTLEIKHPEALQWLKHITIFTNILKGLFWKSGKHRLAAGNCQL